MKRGSGKASETRVEQPEGPHAADVGLVNNGDKVKEEAPRRVLIYMTDDLTRPRAQAAAPPRSGEVVTAASRRRIKEF